MGQKCLVSVSSQREILNFDLGHPVVSYKTLSKGKLHLLIPNSCQVDKTLGNLKIISITVS